MSKGGLHLSSTLSAQSGAWLVWKEEYVGFLVGADQVITNLLMLRLAQTLQISAEKLGQKRQKWIVVSPTIHTPFTDRNYNTDSEDLVKDQLLKVYLHMMSIEVRATKLHSRLWYQPNRKRNQCHLEAHGNRA
jgi:hypothetical protein